MHPRFPLIVITALAPLIWGSTYLVTTEFLPPERPFYAALFRALPAGILLLLWTREIPARREWLPLFLLGALNISFFQAMLFIAAYRLPGGLAAILTSTQTLMILALMALIGTQQPPKSAWLAAAIGVIGIALLVYSPDARFDSIGIIAGLLSAVAGAIGGYFTKRWQTTLSILGFTGWQLLFGGLCLLPVALLAEPPLPAPTLSHIGGYMYLCLVGSVLAYVLFFRGISKLPVPVVLSLGLLSPVSAYALGWIFLGQSMDGKAFLGFALTLLSIYGVQRAMFSSHHHKAHIPRQTSE